MDSTASKMTDLGFLENFTGNNRERMAKYISIFLDSAPVEMEALRKSLASQSRDGIRAAAHSLKPQMTYMGIKSGEALLVSLGQLAEAEAGFDLLGEQVGRFDTIFTTACEELKTHLTQLNP